MNAAAEMCADGMMHITLATTQQQPPALDQRTQEEIANEFQLALLMYRPRNSAKIVDSKIDVSRFTPALRLLARSIAMCFPEDLALAAAAVELRRPQNEELQGQRFRDVDYAIVEVLLAAIHEGKKRAIQVDDLAELVNALLYSRGEILLYSAEQIGWRLRGLHVSRHSNNTGRKVLLDRNTSQSLHRLAQVYELAIPSTTGCPDCSPAQAELCSR